MIVDGEIDKKKYKIVQNLNMGRFEESEIDNVEKRNYRLFDILYY